MTRRSGSSGTGSPTSMVPMPTCSGRRRAMRGSCFGTSMSRIKSRVASGIRLLTSLGPLVRGA